MWAQQNTAWQTANFAFFTRAAKYPTTKKDQHELVFNSVQEIISKQSSQTLKKRREKKAAWSLS